MFLHVLCLVVCVRSALDSTIYSSMVSSNHYSRVAPCLFSCANRVRSFGSCRKLSIYLSGQECVFKTNLIAHLLTKCAHTHALCFDLNHVRLHARLLTEDMKQMERNILDPSTEHGGNKGGCVLLVQRTSVYN